MLCEKTRVPLPDCLLRERVFADTCVFLFMFVFVFVTVFVTVSFAVPCVPCVH